MALNAVLPIEESTAKLLNPMIPRSLISLLVASLCAASSAWAVKPFPKDPVEKAKALERYKQGLALYAKGQKFHREKKFDDANATYGKAMDLFLDGPKPDMANSYNSLGNAFLQKEPEIALWYYARALAIRKQDHGQEHEAVASSYNHVGIACIKMEEYDRAITYFEGAMNIFWRVNRKRDNAQVGAGHIHLGSTYTAKKEHQKAVEHFEKAADIFLKVFGPKHPNVARVKRDLGFAVIENGDKKRGLALLLEAKGLFDATMGAGFIETQELVEQMNKLK